MQQLTSNPQLGQSGKVTRLPPTLPPDFSRPSSEMPDDGSCFAAYEAWQQDLLWAETSLKDYEKALKDREKELDNRETELEKKICLPPWGN